MRAGRAAYAAQLETPAAALRADPDRRLVSTLAPVSGIADSEALDEVSPIAFAFPFVDATVATARRQGRRPGGRGDRGPRRACSLNPKKAGQIDACLPHTHSLEEAELMSEFGH
jgi:hypothetical protein